MSTDDAALVGEIRERLAPHMGEDGWSAWHLPVGLDRNRWARLLDLAEEALKLRKVRDAAEEVRDDGALCPVPLRCDCCNELRAALDAAKEGR